MEKITIPPRIVSTSDVILPDGWKIEGKYVVPNKAVKCPHRGLSSCWFGRQLEILVHCFFDRTNCTILNCQTCAHQKEKSPNKIPWQPSITYNGVVLQESKTLSEMTWSLAVAFAQFIVSGAKTVTREEYEERIRICDACLDRKGWRCPECGCVITLKARGRVWKCAKGKWPPIKPRDKEKSV